MSKFRPRSKGAFAVEQPDLLKYAVQALERLGIPYALVGSFASSTWGESRFTQDIDLLIDLKPGQVESLCAAFPDENFYVSRVAAEDAVDRHGQFNVIHPASGNKIDFMIAGPASWVRAQFERCKTVTLSPGFKLDVAAPEDVILGKLIYYQEGRSEKHLRDITGILKMSGDMVDRSYVAKVATQLGVAEIWQSVLNRLNDG